MGSVSRVVEDARLEPRFWLIERDGSTWVTWALWFALSPPAFAQQRVPITIMPVASALLRIEPADHLLLDEGTDRSRVPHIDPLMQATDPVLFHPDRAVAGDPDQPSHRGGQAAAARWVEE
mgnify:CR=1 FL=1